MKKQRSILIGAACSLFSCHVVIADIYTSSVAADTNGISAWTLPGSSGDGAMLLWDIVLGSQLEPSSYSVGIGHVWYDAAEYDVVDPAYTATGTEFANALTGYTDGSINMSVNTPFYLGFWLDADEDTVADTDDRYGWAQMVYDGTDLHLVGNAISDMGSITVGVVPEPSTGALLITACLSILACRRRNRS